MKLILLSVLASISISAHASTNVIQCSGGGVVIDLSSNERALPSKIPNSVVSYMKILKRDSRIAHVRLDNKLVISHMIAKEGQALYTVQAVGSFAERVICSWASKADIEKETRAIQKHQRKIIEREVQESINRQETLRIEKEARDLSDQRNKEARELAVKNQESERANTVREFQKAVDEVNAQKD